MREKSDVASKGGKGHSGPEGCPRPPQQNPSFSPRSEETSYPVISGHPVNPYSSPDSLPPGGFLSQPDEQVSFLRILVLPASPSLQDFPHLAGLRAGSCTHRVSGNVPSTLWSNLIESSTLEVSVVIIPRLREVKSLFQDHTAGESISAS